MKYRSFMIDLVKYRQLDHLVIVSENGGDSYLEIVYNLYVTSIGA